MVLNFGLYIGYYFGVLFGAWRYIYGNRDPKEIFNHCQSKRVLGRLQKVGIFRPEQHSPGNSRSFHTRDKNQGKKGFDKKKANELLPDYADDKKLTVLGRTNSLAPFG